MKVRVKDLKPNPFRNLEKYQVDKAKVEALKASIKQTAFWDNILAREVKGQIQLAYGHHRLVALKELGIEEIDIPVKEIDDATMLRIMANENMDDWKAAPSVVMETVRAAKAFIEEELAKCETWEEFSSPAYRGTVSGLIQSEPAFRKIKGSGVGTETIHAFLGKQWSRYLIENTLSVIKEEEDAARKKAEAYVAAQKAAEERRKQQEADAVAKVERDRLAALEAKRKAKEDEERRALEAEAKAAKARRDAEEKARRDEEAKLAKIEADKRAAEKAKVEAERQARAKAAREAQEKADAEAKARDAERRRLEAERKAAEDASRKAQEIARKAQEAAAAAAKEAEALQAEADKAEQDGVDREAFEMFATVRKARMFHRAVKANNIPKKYHKELAQKHRDDNSNEYALLFRQYAVNMGFVKVPPKQPKPLDSFDDAVRGTITKASEVARELERYAPFLGSFQIKSVEKQFYETLETLQAAMNKIKKPLEKETVHVGREEYLAQ